MKSNISGKNLQSTLNQNPELNLLNPMNLPTRLHPNTGKTSNLDLIVTSKQYLKNEILTRDGLGSDHSTFLMLKTEKTKPRLLFRPRWQFKEEN